MDEGGSRSEGMMVVERGDAADSVGFEGVGASGEKSRCQSSSRSDCTVGRVAPGRKGGAAREAASRRSDAASLEGLGCGALAELGPLGGLDSEEGLGVEAPAVDELLRVAHELGVAGVRGHAIRAEEVGEAELGLVGAPEDVAVATAEDGGEAGVRALLAAARRCGAGRRRGRGRGRRSEGSAATATATHSAVGPARSVSGRGVPKGAGVAGREEVAVQLDLVEVDALRRDALGGEVGEAVQLLEEEVDRARLEPPRRQRRAPARDGLVPVHLRGGGEDAAELEDLSCECREGEVWREARGARVSPWCVIRGANAIFPLCCSV